MVEITPAILISDFEWDDDELLALQDLLTQDEIDKMEW